MQYKVYSKKRNSASTSKQPSKKKKFINCKKSSSAVKGTQKTRLGLGHNQLIAQTQLNSIINDQALLATTSKGQIDTNQLGQDLGLV